MKKRRAEEESVSIPPFGKILCIPFRAYISMVTSFMNKLFQLSLTYMVFTIYVEFCHSNFNRQMGTKNLNRSYFNFFSSFYKVLVLLIYLYKTTVKMSLLEHFTCHMTYKKVSYCMLIQCFQHFWPHFFK